VRLPVANRLLLLPALLALAGASGCKRHCWYEWRDEPYVRKVHRRGERKALQQMRSFWIDDREIGARALAVIAREAREAGDETTARRLAHELMDHYRRERDFETRGVILALCLREAGEGDPQVQAFLKSRLNSGEHPAAAAYSLASLRPPGAFEAIAAAYRRARSHGLRYELLGALWLLGDRRAIPLIEGALAELDREWPERVHGMRKALYRRALAGRLRSLRLACAAETEQNR
jgi:hypothetical protein